MWVSIDDNRRVHRQRYLCSHTLPGSKSYFGRLEGSSSTRTNQLSTGESCKNAQEADIGGMNPEELPRPKGPKVEPIDRRGKRMLEYKAKLSANKEDTPTDPLPTDESPAEQLERVSTDPGASLKEIRQILLYFLPHVELIEIEMMLARCLPTSSAETTPSEHLPRFHRLLQEVNTQGIIHSKTYQLADHVRKIRNGLFHENRQLTDDDTQKIKELWRVLEKSAPEFESLSQEVATSVDFGLKEVVGAQRTAKKLLAIAYLIEIEQELKRVLNELMTSDEVLKNIYVQHTDQPGNSHALHAILSSNSNFYGALKRLHLIDDLKLSVSKRHELVHPKEINDCPADTLRSIARAWRALRTQQEILKLDQTLFEIERQLRLFLQANGMAVAVTEAIRIQKLVKITCEDQAMVHRLNSAKVGRKMLLGLNELYIEIFDGTLQPPTAQYNTELLHILTGIQAATETSLDANSQNLEANRHTHSKKANTRNRLGHSKNRSRLGNEDPY